MVLDGAAVGDDHALIAPLVPEDVRQKAPALADVGAVDQIVGGHHRGGAALFNDPLEGRQEDLPQSPLLHDVVVDGAHVIGVIADEVLHTGPHPVVLEALDIARSHVAGQHRVLGVVLKAPPVQGTAPGVQPRAEQHPGPQGPALRRHGRPDLLRQGGVPGAGQAGSRREAGGLFRHRQGLRGVEGGVDGRAELGFFGGRGRRLEDADAGGAVRHHQPGNAAVRQRCGAELVAADTQDGLLSHAQLRQNLLNIHNVPPLFFCFAAGKRRKRCLPLPSSLPLARRPSGGAGPLFSFHSHRRGRKAAMRQVS